MKELLNVYKQVMYEKYPPSPGIAVAGKCPGVGIGSACRFGFGGL